MLDSWGEGLEVQGKLILVFSDRLLLENSQGAHAVQTATCTELLYDCLLQVGESTHPGLFVGKAAAANLCSKPTAAIFCCPTWHLHYSKLQELNLQSSPGGAGYGPPEEPML